MKRLYWGLGGLSLLLAALSSFVASEAPDGLERVALELGLQPDPAPHATLMPDYQLSALGAHLGGSLAGLFGVAATLALSLALGWFLRPRKTP